MTLTRSKVKVKVTGLLNFRQLAKACMLAAMTAAPLRGFLVPQLTQFRPGSICGRSLGFSRECLLQAKCHSCCAAGCYKALKTHYRKISITCTGELRNTLLEFELGVRSNSGGGIVRKITPVTTRAQQQQTAEETSQLPLQVLCLWSTLIHTHTDCLTSMYSGELGFTGCPFIFFLHLFRMYACTQEDSQNIP